MKIVRMQGSILDRHRLENLISDTAKNAADLDYVAMMAGVELESPEQEVNADEV